MQGIGHRYVQIAEAIADRIRLPAVVQIYVPPPAEVPGCVQKFGAVVLADGSVGIMFLLLDALATQLQQYVDSLGYQGNSPLLLAQSFPESDPIRKTLALGALNAIGHFILRNCAYRPDYTTDSMALFDPQPGDVMGMVGYFPPLVRRIRAAGIPLTVIELKEELVTREDGFVVTTDARELRRCSKVLCTSTVLLNDSLDDILQNCRQAERVAIIGPSAGFLPDPLFERGVDTIGGTYIEDAAAFLANCSELRKWGPAARKYCIRKEGYPGYATLLAEMVNLE